MQFVYPANLSRTTPSEVVVSFRDLPECLTSGADTSDALSAAADALAEALAGRIDDGDPIPNVIGGLDRFPCLYDSGASPHGLSGIDHFGHEQSPLVAQENVVGWDRRYLP